MKLRRPMLKSKVPNAEAGMRAAQLKCHATYERERAQTRPHAESRSKVARMLTLIATMLATATAGTVVAQTRTNSTLNRLAAEFQAAYNRGDVEALASFYAEDAVLMPPNRPKTQGRTAIVATLRRNLGSDPATMLLTPVESAIAGDHAYEVGTRVMKWPSGTTLVEKYARVYKLVGHEWKIAYFIWNSDSAEGPPR